MNIEHLNLINDIIDNNQNSDNQNNIIENITVKSEHTEIFTKLNITDPTILETIYSVLITLSKKHNIPLLNQFQISICNSLINNFNLEDTNSILTAHEHFICKSFSINLIFNSSYQSAHQCSNLISGLSAAIIKQFQPSQWLVIKNKVEEVNVFLSKMIGTQLFGQISNKNHIDIAMNQFKHGHDEIQTLLVFQNILIKNLDEIIEYQNIEIMEISYSNIESVTNKIKITNLENQFENASKQMGLLPHQFRKIFTLTFNSLDVESIYSHQFTDQKLLFTCIEDLHNNKLDNTIQLNQEHFTIDNQKENINQNTYINERVLNLNILLGNNNINIDRLIFILKRLIVVNEKKSSLTLVMYCSSNDKNQIEMLNLANQFIKKDLKHLSILLKINESNKHQIRDLNAIQRINIYNKKLLMDLESSDYENNEMKQKIVRGLKTYLDEPQSSVSSESRDSTDFSSKNSKISSAIMKDQAEEINLSFQYDQIQSDDNNLNINGSDGMKCQKVKRKLIGLSNENLDEYSVVLDIMLSQRLKPIKTLKYKKLIYPVLYLLKTSTNINLNTSLILIYFAMNMKINNNDFMKTILSKVIVKLEDESLSLYKSIQLDLLQYLCKKIGLNLNLKLIKLKHRNTNINDKFDKFYSEYDFELHQIDLLTHKIKKIPYICKDSKYDLLLKVCKQTAINYSEQILKFNSNQFYLEILKNQIVKSKFMLIFENYMIVSLSNQLIFEVQTEQNEWIHLFQDIKKVKTNSNNQITKQLQSLQNKYAYSEIVDLSDSEIILKNLFILILIQKLKFDIETSNQSMLKIANQKLIDSLNLLIKDNKFSKTIYEFLILSKINQMQLRIINNDHLENNINEFQEIYSKNNQLMVYFQQIIEVEYYQKKKNNKSMNESQLKFKDLVKNNDLKETFKKNLQKLSKKILLQK